MTEQDVLNNSRRELGDLFIKHREKRGLSVGEVADALKVLSSAIVGIESADYSKIKGEIFVRGYIRSYAQFLNLDEVECLNLYGESPEEVIEVISPPLISTNKKSPVGAMIMAVACLLLIAIAYWFFTQTPGSTQQALEVPVSEQSQGQLPNITEPGDTLAATINTTEPDLIVEEPEFETAQVPEQPEGGVKLVFTEDCWVEVTDSEGKKLLADLKRQGDEVHLSGVAPYNLLLGYGPAVAVYYKGEQVNFEVNINNPTVKLTVGDES